MSAFWQLETHPAEHIALVEAERNWTYAQLAALADHWMAQLPDGPGLGLLAMPNTASAIALYLACLRSGRQVPLLLQPGMDPALLADLVAHYQPDWIALPEHDHVPGQAVRQHAHQGMQLHHLSASAEHPALHPELGLLLSTSGSTGSAKLVRLSREGLAANSRAIVEYLGLTHEDRAITTLPLAYSYGMSILNSHLQAGGSLVLTDAPLVSREFWTLARTHGITSLSGVPATFEMLRRVGLQQHGLDRLRMLTQAGGKLRDAMVEHFAKLGSQSGVSFFVMYGQTEASPRISYLPPDRLPGKIGSIGIAIPGGDLSLHPETGELVYRGPNVMLGYAGNRQDLALGDVLQGVLHTGDLARRDDDGFYYITGRAKRFIKLSGNRVNLDEVEALLSAEYATHVACSGRDDRLLVFLPTDAGIDESTVKQFLQLRLRIFSGLVRVHGIQALPTLSNGKIDYNALMQIEESGT
ncbi:AMP-binding protein [Luteimonas sp. e5]